jgi:hypothetical protein
LGSPGCNAHLFDPAYSGTAGILGEVTDLQGPGLSMLPVSLYDGDIALWTAGMNRFGISHSDQVCSYWARRVLRPRRSCAQVRRELPGAETGTYWLLTRVPDLGAREMRVGWKRGALLFVAGCSFCFCRWLCSFCFLCFSVFFFFLAFAHTGNFLFFFGLVLFVWFLVFGFCQRIHCDMTVLDGGFALMTRFIQRNPSDMSTLLTGPVYESKFRWASWLIGEDVAEAARDEFLSAGNSIDILAHSYFALVDTMLPESRPLEIRQTCAKGSNLAAPGSFVTRQGVVFFVWFCFVLFCFVLFCFV